MLRKTPSTTLLKWIRRLPERLQQEIARYALSGLPHLAPGRVTDSKNAMDLLIAHLEHCKKEPFEDAMGAASIAGVVDVLFASRSTRDDWERSRETQRRLVAKAEREGQPEFAAFVRHELSKLDSRAGQWCKAGEAWSQLRETELSSRAIDDFILSLYSDDEMHDFIKRSS